MDPWIKLVFDYSPALAVGAILAIVVTGALLKALGVTGIADKSKLAAGISDIGTKLSEVEQRLGSVEHDITNRPTREEMHRLELSFTRLEGEVRSQGMTIQSTAAAIGRIEDYMYAAAASRRGQGPT